MTPDRLRAWLNRHRAKAVNLRVTAVHLGNDVVVREWTREELAEVEDATGLVLDTCQDWVENERAKTDFRIQWLNASGAPIITANHTATPQTDEELPAGAMNANAGNSLDKLLAHMMLQDTAKTKIVVGFLGEALKGVATLQGIQQEALKTAHAENQLLRQLLQAALSRTPGETEETEEAKAESVARVEMYNKLGELAPDVGRLLLAALHERFGGGGGANGGMHS